MLVDAAPRSSASRRLFSPLARDVLLTLTYRFPVALSYIIDDAGNEVVGIVQAENDYGVAIAYPVPGGYCAEDASVGLLGVFATVEELCAALVDHVGCFCAPNTVH